MQGSSRRRWWAAGGPTAATPTFDSGEPGFILLMMRMMCSGGPWSAMPGRQAVGGSAWRGGLRCAVG